MIPSALTAMLQQGIADFLRMSFWSSTPGMEGAIDRLVQGDGAVFKGPYVSLKMPFQRTSADDFFPEIPLPEPAFVHQQHAWRRLTGQSPRSTLVATGTGSGKTECFLLPILDHCRRAAGTPGVKAILIYPMNALATDQARRIAELCSRTPALRGIRAGLYIGEYENEEAVRRGSMGADHVITDRKRMQRDPPDLLLTNYKMLDYLLVRPADQEMWAPNKNTPVEYLVVDELHSFDGAQGTDLACLVRRLKSRLASSRGKLCCVGTSATLGTESGSEKLRAYAEQIFGEPFDSESVIGESRQPPEEFFGTRLIEQFQVPTDVSAMDPAQYSTPEEFVAAQQRLWMDEPIAAEPNSDDWKVALGEQLLRHAVTRNLVVIVGAKPTALAELTESLARTSRELKADQLLAERAVVSILALISCARTWRHERPETRTTREAEGRSRPTGPLVEARVQLWLRALQRMVGEVGIEPNIRFSDDLTDDQRGRHLPVVHCRDCGAMGWATCVARDRPDNYGVGLERFYRAFFSDDSQVRFLFPAAAAVPTGQEAFQRFFLDSRTLIRVRDQPPPDAIEVVQSESTHTVAGRREMHRDCPFCGARQSLALLGFRAATLTAVFIDQLFSTRFNGDKKLLAFSDSVQDAAHRAGFFGARTWSFNLRVAIQAAVADAEGATLAELPAVFNRTWHSKLDDIAFVSTFLAPNMEWLSEYEAMQSDGVVPPSLVDMVERRIAYEVANEYGLQTRIGRSLPRTGCSVVAVDDQKLDVATDAALVRLQNEIGGLRKLDRGRLRVFLLGALIHLREAGGVLHPELPERFVLTAGQDDYAFKLVSHLPSFGPRSRFGALLTTDPRSRRFDRIFEGGASGWYARWVERVLGGDSRLIGDPASLWQVVIPVLVSTGILKEMVGQRGTIWGLAPEALRVTNSCARLRCPSCRHFLVVAASEVDQMRGSSCLGPACTGLYDDDDQPTLNYFGHLIRQGEVQRVFPEEHTGLLPRAAREEIETQFKAEERKPWYANLLSCTPTLEMGIDIGSLSTAILCSVPPGQANYLQRIGRAGRRDGNSVVLAIAQSRPHDLYFYAKPTEMIAGEVQPPGVFLNASGVLERQLTAFSLDRWNASAGQHRFAYRLKEVFTQLETPSEERFPHNWLAFVRAEQAGLLTDFFRLFNPDDDHAPEILKEGTRAHLNQFLMGNDLDEGSLSWKVLDAFQREKKSAESLRRKARRLKDTVKELETAIARDRNHDDKIAEHRREQEAYEKLAREIGRSNTLEFLTNEGLLPNYAFPEAPVRLRSIIWRKKRAQAKNDCAPAFETRTYDYSRPPVAALGELALAAQFFAGGRKVAIDQVDVDTAEIETWRFCDACSHCVRAEVDGNATDCPRCGSPGWGEESQRRQLLRLQQVFARSSDRESRIRDDVEERQPRFFNRHMLLSFQDEDRQGAWQLEAPAVPFAFEYLRRARFRELNFGERADDGTKFSIAGRSEARKGFIICKKCGKVQPEGQHQQKLGTEVRGDHTMGCTARARGEKPTDFEAAIYLYREFASEAVRLLLPLADMGSELRLHSFVAAFQLGLKARYGGRVDHLHTLVYSEPDRGSLLRRQFLVLYDSVPGGTGYLKDLMRAPGPGEEHALIQVIRLARDRIRSCECFGDPIRDGCYRCLFAYRNSRDMSETSAHEASSMLSAILDEANSLRPTESLSDVSVAGLMDSVLEARFVEALQRLGAPELPVSVRKSLVRNKPGYSLSVGEMEWLIEPQVEIGAAQGLPINVSIDFVLRPASSAAGRRAVAVFLDGFQHHRDRVGYDMLQRMSLLSAGQFDVWGFTWHDVDAAFDRSVALPPQLLHPDSAHLKQFYRGLKLGAFARVLDTAPMDLLIRSLSKTEDDTPWAKLGALALIAQMQLPSQIDVSSWRQEVGALVPDPLKASLMNFDEQSLFACRQPEEPHAIGLWATVSQAAAGDHTLARLDEVRAVVWLDDAPERYDTAEYREAWQGYLFMFLLLRSLPHVLFLTRTSQHRDGYAALAQMRAVASEAASTGRWPWEDVRLEFHALRPLATTGVALPQIGIDLPDNRGLSSGVEGELVWEEKCVAVVRELDDVTRRRVAPNWQLFVLDDLVVDLTPLVQALRGTNAGEDS